MTKAPIKLVRFKDAFSRRETMINPDRVAGRRDREFTPCQDVWV